MRRTAAHTFMFMAALTLISKLLGFIREMIMANFYGTSYIVDAYVMATTIPSIIFGGIFGAVAIAYMPTYSKIHRKDGETGSNKFTSQVINIIVILSIIASLIGIFLSDQIVQIFASGFEGETAKLTSFFVKITFTYVVFTATGNILGSYLNYKGIFLKPIIAGYFQNLAVIVVIIISSFSTHYILALGMLIGAGLRLIYLFIISTKAGYKYTPSFSFNKTVRSIIGLAIPVFIGTYIDQINTFVDKTLASRLPEGSVAALNYGMILVGLFTGLTVTLLVTMIYPRITKASTNEDWADFNDVIEKGMNVIIIISVPISFGIIAFSDEVVQIVYERGAFDAFATGITAGAFFYYGIGLVFFSLNALFVKIFYSLHNTKVSIICAGLSVIINVSLDFLLIGPMAQDGLALATSIAASVNTLLLYYWIKYKYPQIRIMKSKRKMAKIVSSAAIAVGFAYLTNWLLTSNIWMPRMMYIGSSVIVAVLMYYVLLRIFKIDETKLIGQVFRKPDTK
ncbi:MAG TPA: murein biosynthesis integral membrane protein MurJ [Clostridia bacterium]|nr:murein biosynthesis integral membrane protein MurJ [Clostridia bacterium]